MRHTKSDQKFVLLFSAALIITIAGIGLAVNQLTYPLPPPTPTFSSEPKIGIFDYASLFAKMDQDLHDPEPYHILLTEFADCIPNFISSFTDYPTTESLTKPEVAALEQFVMSGAIMLAFSSKNSPQTYSVHDILNTAVVNCPPPPKPHSPTPSAQAGRFLPLDTAANHLLNFWQHHS